MELFVLVFAGVAVEVSALVLLCRIIAGGEEALAVIEGKVSAARASVHELTVRLERATIERSNRDKPIGWECIEAGCEVDE